MTFLEFDFETRSPVNIKKRGAYNYAHDPATDLLCLAFAVDRGDVHVWTPPWCHPDGAAASAREMEVLRDLCFRAVEDRALCLAHNAAFDFEVWNFVAVRLYGFPPLSPDQVICSAAQVAASGCPRGLDGAGEALKITNKKDRGGKNLIRALCVGTRDTWEDTPQRRTLMRDFRVYAKRDILAMRDVFAQTRPLVVSEWVEYQASEAVNRRGVLVDVEFAKAAAGFAAEEQQETNARLRDMTNDSRMSIHAHPRKAKWVYDNLETAPELRPLVVKPPKDGKPRFGLDKDVRRALQNALADPRYEADPVLFNVSEVVTEIENANSAAVAKFKRIAELVDAGGRLRGMYLYNGGGQTGRYSSVGAQTHNMTRDVLFEGDPDATIHFMEAVTRGDLETANATAEKAGLSLLRALARCARSSIIAKPGHVLVWADLASIEWVVLSWMVGGKWGAGRLDQFRARRDPYRVTAAQIYKTTYEEIPKSDDRRQVGKIAELALGYLGGVGALRSMARKFDMSFSVDEATEVVQGYRRANGGLVRFGDRCMARAQTAIENPGVWFDVGRISYMFNPDLMRGTLLCRLPSQRVLTYPAIRVDQVFNEQFGRFRTEITYRKAKGGSSFRTAMWRGILVENPAQAIAKDLLGPAIVEFRDSAVLHTHDELGLEVPEEDEEKAATRLREVFETIPPWGEGLELRVDVDSGPYYHK